MKRCGVDHEYKLAAIDVKCVADQYGAPVIIRLQNEGTVTRDRYGSIINRSKNADKIELNALSITYSPTDKQKNDAGIREKTSVIIYTAVLDWDNAGITIQQLNSLKADVIINDETFEIVDKSFKDQFGIKFLYVVLGLNKK